MNKLNLVIMAALCVLLTSCSEQEFSETSLSAEISSRSIEQVVVSYTDASEQAVTQICTRLELKYNGNATMDMIFILSNDSVLLAQGSDVLAQLNSGSELDLLADGGNQPVSMTEVYVDVCAEELCYNNASESIFGAGLSFIIEDCAFGL